MAWHQQQQHKQHQFVRNNNGYQVPQRQRQPQQQAPVHLKRQASDLKSMYPVTKWCACYVNTKSSSSSSDFDDNLDVTSQIPSTNVYLPMDLEENIMAEVEMYIDEEKETTDRLSQQKMEINASKNKAESDKNEKIATFMSFTSITDRNTAMQLLEANGWDLQKAAAQQFSSNAAISPDVMPQEGGGGGGGYQHGNGGAGPGGQKNEKAIIRMILPDNRQYTYQMDGNDTFWGVYGRLLQSCPELASKAFGLELQNGHVLNENEFDQSLSQAHLIPRGDIRVKY